MDAIVIENQPNFADIFYHRKSAIHINMGDTLQE